uniref:Small EDRK-rich factor-like N-terminal domain-containing protein n=1 Tax=Lactuca sativa TaxID=4236 RepID=A0A9R1V9L8_LACSA|nr:hypothetical protein LSAT_V11C600321570 [Lactuca sativa]
MQIYTKYARQIHNTLIYRIERGNQREKDRERANARGGAKGKNKDDGLTPEQRRERGELKSLNSEVSDRDGKALQEKAAKKAEKAAGSGDADKFKFYIA